MVNVSVHCNRIDFYVDGKELVMYIDIESASVTICTTWLSSMISRIFCKNTVRFYDVTAKRMRHMSVLDVEANTYKILESFNIEPSCGRFAIIITGQ